MNQRRGVLLAILTVALGLFLLDSHGSVGQMIDDLRTTWDDMHHSPAAGLPQ